MGFVSFKTTGGKSIPNIHQHARATFPVYMHGPGSHASRFEPAYDGYATFGGKNVHVFLCEINNLATKAVVKRFNAFFAQHVETFNKMSWDERHAAGYPHWLHLPENEEYQGEDEGIRYLGILLEAVMASPAEAKLMAEALPELGAGCKDMKHPQFSQHEDKDGMDFSKPLVNCPAQGFFYTEEEEEA